MTNDYKYVIVDIFEITEEMLDNAIENSINSLRVTNSGASGILKFRGATPSVFSPYDRYSRDEIRSVINGPDWRPAT